MGQIPLLQDLVACNSVNPALVPGAAGEGAVAEVAGALPLRGEVEVMMQIAAPGRPNVIGVLDGRIPGPLTLQGCGT